MVIKHSILLWYWQQRCLITTYCGQSVQELLEQKNISDRFSPLDTCIPKRKERQHQSLACLWLYCNFHYDWKGESFLVLLWPFKELIQLINLTRNECFGFFGICCVCFLEPFEGKQREHVCMGGTALHLWAAKFLDEPVKSYPSFQRYCRSWLTKEKKICQGFIKKKN